MSLLAVLLITLSGCKATVNIPEVVHEPEIVGEVVKVGPALEEGPRERRAQFDLSNDQVVVLDLNAARNLGGPEPMEGHLLLYGTEPDGPWFWAGPLRDDPVTGRQCAFIEGRALEQDDAIVFEIGLRLPKANDFDPAEVRDGEYTQPNRFFCVDEHGDVTRYGA